jgi:hypothetical protein
MKPFEKELNQLKNLLITSEEFDEVYRYFLDHLGENQKFLDIGEKAEHPVLTKVMELVAQQVFHKKIAISRMLLIKIPEHHFYHGPCMLGNTMASLFFFEDIDMGLISILMALDSREVRFVRFSSMQVKGDGEVFFTKPRNKEIH